MKRLVSSLALLLLLVAQGSASAQDPTAYDAQRFDLAPSQRANYFALHQARVLASWELGLALNYADSPLVLQDADGARASELVASQLTGHVLGAVGIGGRVQVGLDIPLILSQTGDEVPLRPALDASDAGFGVGDLRLVTKLLLFGPDEGRTGVAMAVVVDWMLPTSGATDYQGESFRAAPALALDGVLARGARLGLNVGALFRQEVQVENLTVQDALTYGVALSLPVGAPGRVFIVPEVRGETVLAAAEFGSEESPLEWLLGFKFLGDRGALVEGGFGTGLVNGVGVPDWRLFFGLSFAGIPETDRDQDGLLDDADRCPDDPEDLDGFEDADGCPDPDNDLDGVLDAVDGCPLQPEDLDGFQDHDGCPDPDNDGDGLPDGGDRCPNEAEDRDGDRDDDGCPDGDRDADGYADEIDMCPAQAEDFDGFEDEDGCPEPDNDRDGLLDPVDACPLQAEDFDMDRDDDGCPEGPVLTCDEIVIEEQVLFETASDVIQAVSHQLLDAVAALLIATPDVRLIEVQGHTDGQGDEDYNLDLSNRRAASVRRYLENTGVSPDRLTSRGLGESMPIDTNETEAGRRNNRRVVFRILAQDNTCD